MAARPIDLLLRTVPDNPSSILQSLTQDASLASTADDNGYTLLHAAASYNKLDLLRTLITQYHVSVNIKDDEGQTPLYYAETVAAARCLVEEFGADISVVDDEGIAAEEMAKYNADCSDDPAEWALVAEYLGERRVAAFRGGESTNGTNGTNATNGVNGDSHSLDLPPGVTITGVRRVADEDVGEAPDPEFRRRIEALAARDDFEGEAGQAELRRLVTDAMGRLPTEEEERSVRRRVD